MIEHDTLIEQLRRERPVTPEAEDHDADRLLHQILATSARPPRARLGRRGRRAVLTAAAPAAAAAALVVALLAAGTGTPAPTGGSHDAAAPAVVVDMQRISSATSAALRTGRAKVAYVGNRGAASEQRATGTVAFSGDDIEMRFHFEPVMGRGAGFDAENRTVGGEFYLLDGPPDAQRWYHDTNASGGQRSDFFNTDPRTLLAVLAPVADFVPVDAADGVRHLRATRLDRLPALNLPLGPIDPRTIEHLEVWVGDDDVVRRFDIGLLHLESRPKHPLVMTREGKQRMARGQLPPIDPADMETIAIRDSYSVEFVDAGLAIEIAAPPHPVDIAGRG